MIYLFLAITVLSLFFTLKMRKPILLTVPFATIFVYLIVQIAMVPMGFFETVKFIFSLR
ncbi:hypothetical protein ACJ2A9_20915 [Anaerobacillus sp. MEB173]|uniref:hypothetical protein n=1 Tax=Anaerobacillus sp. MEB173 TaxID=3383345 RepID=UPI003F8F5D0F